MTVTSISPTTLAKRHDQGEEIELIDVRTPPEFRQEHVQFARNIPLDQLDPAAVMQLRSGLADMPLFFICQGR